MRLGKQTLRKLVREELSKVNEGIEPQIKKIAQLTGTRPDAVEDFVSKHALNFTKLLKFLQKGKLKDRMDFMTAVSGKPGNPIQKKMIKMFTESVVNERKPSKIVWDTKKISAAKRINVRKWYMKTYPSDELGDEINQKLTLWDFYNALSQDRDIYKVIGVGDSVVRERIFEKLSKVLGVAYDTIYNMWESINEANGKVDLSLPFAVIRKGGSIGSSTKNYIPTDKGVIVSTFNNQNDAKEEAASLRKTLSPQAKQYYKTTYTVTKLTDYKRKLIKNKTESINETSDEFVIYVEKDNGRKKLLHNNKSSRAAKMFITKNANKILNQPGIRAVGSMRKSDWERDEAQYAENIKKKGMRTVTKKQWDRTHNDYKGMIKGQPYMMWFDKKTQSTVYGPVQIKESVNEDTKKRFDVDFYKGNGDRQTSHEEIIRGDKFSDVVSQATKVAKSKGMNYVEFYHRDSFIGSIDKRNGYQFKKGRNYQKSPLPVNEGSIKKSFKVKMYGPKMRTKSSDDVVQMIAKKLKIDRGNSAKDSDKFDEIERQVEKQYDANKREINFKINLKESVNEDVWTSAQKKQVEKLDDEFRNLLAKKGIEPYSNTASKMWKSAGFQKNFQQIFQKDESVNEVNSIQKILRKIGWMGDDWTPKDYAKQIKNLPDETLKIWYNSAKNNKGIPNTPLSFQQKLTKIEMQKRGLLKSVNEANVVGKAVFDDGKGKLAFGYYKDDDEVALVDYKTWKKLNFKDVSKGDTNKDRLVKAILRKQKQFNKKVEYNMWSKKTNPSFEEKMDWFIKNGWISNVTKRGIKEGVNTLMGEGRAFVAAAKKAKEEGKTEFEFNGKTYPVTIKEVLRKRNRKLR